MEGKWEEEHACRIVELATYLLDDLVKEAAGELGLDLLLDPPVRG
jgi:hypothetical protein